MKTSSVQFSNESNYTQKLQQRGFFFFTKSKRLDRIHIKVVSMFGLKHD